MVSEALEVVLSDIKMIGYRLSIKVLIVVRSEAIIPFNINLINLVILLKISLVLLNNKINMIINSIQIKLLIEFLYQLKYISPFMLINSKFLINRIKLD